MNEWIRIRTRLHKKSEMALHYIRNRLRAMLHGWRLSPPFSQFPSRGGGAGSSSGDRIFTNKGELDGVQCPPLLVIAINQSRLRTKKHQPRNNSVASQLVSLPSLTFFFLLLFFLHDDADLNHLCNTPRRNMGECQEEEEEEEEEKSNE